MANIGASIPSSFTIHETYNTTSLTSSVELPFAVNVQSIFVFKNGLKLTGGYSITNKTLNFVVPIPASNTIDVISASLYSSQMLSSDISFINSINNILSKSLVGLPVLNNQIKIDNNISVDIQSITGANALESKIIEHVVTLTGITTLQIKKVFKLTLVSTSTADLFVTPLFSNGVKLSKGYLYIPAGISSFSIYIRTKADAIVETDETYTITVGTLMATGTILEGL